MLEPKVEPWFKNLDKLQKNGQKKDKGAKTESTKLCHEMTEGNIKRKSLSLDELSQVDPWPIQVGYGSENSDLNQVRLDITDIRKNYKRMPI